MQIHQRHIYHGILLAQLADRSAVTVKHLPGHPGHFRVNDNFVLAKRASEPGPIYNFTFAPTEVRKLRYDRLEAPGTSLEAFCALICGKKKICLLQQREWGKLLHTCAPTANQQWVRVKHEPGCQLDVKSSRHKLDHKIPANRIEELLV